jgi:tyrosyl-tRNA synthetase
MLSAEALAENARTYVQQVGRILDLERTDVRYNAEWLSKLTFAEVIRLCSHFTVAEFLKRDNFELRQQRGDAIHLSEFMYAIMQAYDAVAIETDVQVGGSDQLFNLMAGRKLQEEFSQPPQVILTLPILVGTDGLQRMSKSTGNYIGVDEMPNDMYGKVMSIPDHAMSDYFTLLTAVPPDEVQSLLDGVQAGQTPPIEAKKRLAFEITATLHPREAAEAAQAYFEATFQRRETPEQMQEYALHGTERLDHVLVASELASSASEVRRLVSQGAVRVNGEQVADFATNLRPGDEIRVGRTRFLRVIDGAGQ